MRVANRGEIRNENLKHWKKKIYNINRSTNNMLFCHYSESLRKNTNLNNEYA